MWRVWRGLELHVERGMERAPGRAQRAGRDGSSFLGEGAAEAHSARLKSLINEATDPKLTRVPEHALQGVKQWCKAGDANVESAWEVLVDRLRASNSQVSRETCWGGQDARR